ncbi:hypothetical protein C2845_PM07G35880 [Panicum miliaceum]|uniref:Transcription initiation factor IIA gamma subunit C-terminal domain-containing protein n=1 Tax=Panicum miliaceum TaxID=4540 RepID=A0A3L6SL97_PANMI|nr:hypothetical protein C2845_PM07G35880 [Panicum miliaceum]
MDIQLEMPASDPQLKLCQLPYPTAVMPNGARCWFCDNVWTFILTDATFKSEEISETLSKVKIVACDSKLLQPQQ